MNERPVSSIQTSRALSNRHKKPRVRRALAAASATVIATTGLVAATGAPAYAATIDITDVSGTLTDQYNTTGVEGADKAIDNTPYLKYFTPNSTTWLQFQAASPAVVTGYSITSANDYPDRDPRDWIFEGSTNGTTWVTLDTRSNETFVARYARKSYSFSNSTAYAYYRLSITGNAGSPHTQLAEWQIFGTTSATAPAPAAPTGLSAQVISGDQIVLTWQDNTPWETHYRIERSTDGVNWTWSRNLPAGTTRFRSIGLSGNTLYHFRVRAENGTGVSSYATVTATTDSPDLPTTWQEHWFEHVQEVTRKAYSSDVGVYFDDDMNPAALTWINNLTTAVWQYTKQEYGSFSNPRLAAIFHEGKYGGGHPATVFDDSHDYRNVIDIGDSNWTAMTDWQRDVILHEIGHIVEFGSHGVKNSPAFYLWGDSKWAEIFEYDVYVGLGLTADANRVYNSFINTVDNFPRANTYWFRDWFFPIWQNYGQTQALTNFFELLAEHFHQYNGDYARDLNWGEFVHFWSGAAGVNLKPLATAAFGWDATWEQQFIQAQIDFPGVTYA